MKSLFFKFKNRILHYLLGFDPLSFKEDTLATYDLTVLSRDLKCYYPNTSNSMSLANLKIILNDIVINQRKSIVELGSGLSSVYIASLIKRNKINATFVSIEENESWATIVRNYLEIEGLSEICKVIHAPIEINDSIKWYNLDSIEGVKEYMGKIDCLIIDAPAAYLKGNEKIRGGAVPNFKEILSENFAIFLDDSHRQGEQSVLEDWYTEHGLKFNTFNRIGYCIKGGDFNIF